MKSLFLSTGLAFLLSAVSIASEQRIGGLKVAGHAWTWGKGTVFEAIDHCKEVGVDSLEVFLMGQKLSDETGEVLFGEVMPDDAFAALQAKCSASGVRIINAYIGQKQWTRIGQDEAALRKFFDFGKRLGVTGFTGEPAETQWDMVERMVKEYGVTFSIHNHWNGFAAEYFGGPYPYWDPRVTAEKLNAQKRDPRFGLCFDTGHAARSGLDVLAVLKAIQGRCISVHLKDVSAAQLDAHDVPYGHGIVDMPAFLAELRRQEIRGHVGLEYEWSDSPTFATDVKTLVEFIRNSAAFPPPKTLGDVSSYGRNIQRTMRLLATSTPEHRNPVRVLFYGQSITEQGWWKIVADDLKARFPNANLVIENRALGGYSSQLLVKTAETDLYAFQPDLLIFYVYGAHDKYEDIIRRTRERTCAEILQQDDHVTKPEQLTEDLSPVPITAGHWDQFMNFNWLPMLAKKYGTEFCDQRALWKRYLTDYQLAPKDLLKDGVHLNPHGEYVMAEFVKAYLRYDSKLGPSAAEEWVKTLDHELLWHEGMLRLEFAGNRVDAICAAGGASAEVRIDGRKPSELPELYGFTRALAQPGSKWPPIAPIHSEKPLLLEDWTMLVQADPAKDQAYTFSLAGSKTGPDGEGRSDQRFVSNSGRIVLEPGDWNVPFALGVLGGQKPLPAKFRVKWSVVPHFTDTLTPPDRVDPATESTVTLAQGLANTKHTLQLTMGSGHAPISGLRIYRPPLDRH